MGRILVLVILLSFPALADEPGKPIYTAEMAIADIKAEPLTFVGRGHHEVTTPECLFKNSQVLVFIPLCEKRDQAFILRVYPMDFGKTTTNGVMFYLRLAPPKSDTFVVPTKYPTHFAPIDLKDHSNSYLEFCQLKEKMRQHRWGEVTERIDSLGRKAFLASFSEVRRAIFTEYYYGNDEKYFDDTEGTLKKTSDQYEVSIPSDLMEIVNTLQADIAKFKTFPRRYSEEPLCEEIND